MSTTKPKTRKDSVVMYIAIAFVAGFLSGAAFAIYKTSPEEKSNTADNSSVSSQQSQAIQHLEAEITANPDNYQAWSRLGNLYYDTHSYDKAVKAYEKSLELHPGDGNIWTDLGVMYRRTKQPQKAIDAFDKAIEIDPSHEIARLNKGIVLLYDLDKPKEAISSWEDLLNMNPEAKLGNGDLVRDFITSVKQDLAKKQ